MTPAFDLERFVEAQASNYDDALAELRAGKKRSHWSWYVLPQARGLGSSPMSIRFAISGLAEAEAYLAHPVLGPRLVETVVALLSHRERGAEEILGSIDAKKLRSCLTLFARVDGASPLFRAALGRFFSGTDDPATLAALAHTQGDAV